MIHLARVLDEKQRSALGASLIRHAYIGAAVYGVALIFAKLQDDMPYIRGYLARRLNRTALEYLSNLPTKRRRRHHHHHHKDHASRRRHKARNPLSALIYSLSYWYRTSYRETHFFLAVEIGAMILSVAVCVLYTWGTYRMDVSGVLRAFNLVLGIVFSLIWLARFYASELRMKFVLSRSGIFQAFAIPSLLLANGEDEFLHFGYFMAYGAYQAFVRLQKRVLFLRASGKRIMLASSERRGIILENVLHFSALVYILAATIQLLEIPGDILPQKFVDMWEMHGGWNLLNSIYFIIVTLSTVGYGDLSPKTFQGRVFVVFAIVVGIILFSNVITDLVESTTRGVGTVPFRKSPETRHVIVSGSPQLDVLRHFITEFYARYQNTNTKIVVLTKGSSWSSQDFHSLLGSHFLQSRIAYVSGCAMNAKALERADIYTADAIFLMSSPTACKQPGKEDIRTAMQALAIRNLRTDIPIYAMVILRQSHVQVQHAAEMVAAGAGVYREAIPNAAQYRGLYRDVLISERLHLPEAAFEGCASVENILEKTGCRIAGVKGSKIKSEGEIGCDFLFNDLHRSEIMCLQRLHIALLASNILCNGIGTLMTNMAVDIKSQGSPEDPRWLSEYRMGATCELHYGVIPEAFDRVMVRDVANLLYYHGLLLLATQVPNGRIFEPVTKTSTILNKYHVGMFLTYHRRGDVPVALRIAALKFKENPCQFRRVNMSKVKAMKEQRNAFETRLSQIPEEIKSPEFNFSRIDETGLNITTDDEYFSTPNVPRWKGEAGESDINIFDSSLDLSLLRLRGQAIGDVPPGLEDHLIISVPIEQSLGNIPLFLHTLWRKRGKSNYTKRTKKRQVVIICPSVPRQFYIQFRKYLGRCLFLVKGYVHTFSAWNRALLGTAKAVITLSDYTMNGTDADAETMFTTLTLDKMTKPDSDLFITSELMEESSLEYLRLPFHSRRRGADLGEAVCLNSIRKTSSDQSRLERYALTADVEDSDHGPRPPPAPFLDPDEYFHIEGDPTRRPASPPPLDLYGGARSSSLEDHPIASMRYRRTRGRKGTESAGARYVTGRRSGYFGDGEEDANHTEDDDTVDEGDSKGSVRGSPAEGLGDERLLDRKLKEMVEKQKLKDPDPSYRRVDTRRTVVDGRTQGGSSADGSEGSGHDRSDKSDLASVRTRRSTRSNSPHATSSEDENDLSSSESTGDDNEEQDQRRKVRSRRGRLYSRDRYASGELMLYSSLYAVLVREYVEPGFAGLYANMIGGEEGEREGQKVRLFQVPPSLFQGGKDVEYGRIFDLIVQLGGTPLGLYRSGRAKVRLPKGEYKRENRGRDLYGELEELLRTNTKSERGEYRARLACHLNMSPALAFTERVHLNVFSRNGQDEEVSSDDGSERVLRACRRKGKSLEAKKPSAPSSPESSGAVKDNSEKAQDPEGTYTFADRKYEFVTFTESHNLLPYVYTFPDPYTVIAEGDAIYVLCDAQFELPYRWE